MDPNFDNYYQCTECRRSKDAITNAPNPALGFGAHQMPSMLGQQSSPAHEPSILKGDVGLCLKSHHNPEHI